MRPDAPLTAMRKGWGLSGVGFTVRLWCDEGLAMTSVGDRTGGRLRLQYAAVQKKEIY